MFSIKTISILTIVVCLLELIVYIFLFALRGFEDLNDEILEDILEVSESDPFNILLICSFVFNSIWLITSIVQTYFASKNISKNLKIIGIIWICVAIFNFIFDLVITGLYTDKLITNLLDNLVWTDSAFNYVVAYTILLLISTRGIIFLIINIWIIIEMLIKIIRLSKEPKKRTVPLKPPKSVLKHSKETHLEDENIPRVQDWHNHYEEPEEINKPPEKSDIHKFIPRIQKMYSDLRGNSPAPSNRTPNNNQNSHTTGIPGSNTNIMVNGVPSGTLRRQLPWSYMPSLNKSRASPVPPPKPHVPAPDYDLREPQRPQPYTRKDFQQENWSQYT